MLMTERQEREYEQLKSFSDYTDLIKDLDDLASSVSNGEVIDKEISKSIACVSKAMREKVKYIVNISKSWRRKQSWLSVRKDIHQEKEYEEQNKELERLEHYYKNKQIPPPPEKKQTLWSKVKALFCKKPQQIALSNQEEPQEQQNEEKQAETEALECAETDEKREDEEILEENIESEEPDVVEEDYMQF